MVISNLIIVFESNLLETLYENALSTSVVAEPTGV
jgi:hypothetical protein